MIIVEPYVISMADIAGVTHYNGNEIENPTVDNLLFLSGMDTKKGYETIKCDHRTADGTIVNCERFCGIERTDEAWLTLKNRFK